MDLVPCVYYDHYYHCYYYGILVMRNDALDQHYGVHPVRIIHTYMSPVMQWYIMTIPGKIWNQKPLCFKRLVFRY